MTRQGEKRLKPAYSVAPDACDLYQSDQIFTVRLSDIYVHLYIYWQCIFWSDWAEVHADLKLHNQYMTKGPFSCNASGINYTPGCQHVIEWLKYGSVSIICQRNRVGQTCKGHERTKPEPSLTHLQSYKQYTPFNNTIGGSRAIIYYFLLFMYIYTLHVSGYG